MIASDAHRSVQICTSVNDKKPVSGWKVSVGGMPPTMVVKYSEKNMKATDGGGAQAEVPSTASGNQEAGFRVKSWSDLPYAEHSSTYQRGHFLGTVVIALLPSLRVVVISV